MILTCPKCTTSYTIDDAQLGPSGRNVRCQSCRAVWFAEPPEEPIELVAAAEPEPVREVKARELPRLYRQLMIDKKRLKALTQQGIIWGGMAVAFIAILGVAYAFRVDIVRAFPSTEAAFARAGIEVDAVGLKFPKGGQKVVPGLKGGRFVVSVSADVLNLKDSPNPLPPIRARLLDSHGQEISNSLIVLADVTVDAKARRSISFDIPDPKNLATNVTLGWDLMAMKELREKSRYDKYYKKAAEREAAEGAHGGDSHGGGHDDGGHGAPADGHGTPEMKPAAQSLSAEPADHGAPADAHAASSPAADSHATDAHAAPAMKPAAKHH